MDKKIRDDLKFIRSHPITIDEELIQTEADAMIDRELSPKEYREVYHEINEGPGLINFIQDCIHGLLILTRC